jgi:putative Ca2+/H+ antiporter (TMEM165/GDT1 family)
MHALRLGLYVFGVIFVAELPDKTALASLVLATRHRALPVFFGSALALTVQSLVAVAAGSVFALLPEGPVHIGAGILFIVSAVLMWFRKEDHDEDEKAGGAPASKDSAGGFWQSFGTTFGVIFVAEWGDLTQIATAAFAARERAPVLVFASATTALWAVTAIAVLVGNRAAKLLHPAWMQRVAAALFAIVGVALCLHWL